jgi:flagellar motor protein MotB
MAYDEENSGESGGKKKRRGREAEHDAGGHGRSKHPEGPHEEPHEGAPEWLISFADNVVLMMGFFVIMLALATKPASGGSGPGEGGGAAAGASAAELDWAIGVRQGFNNPVDINSTDPREHLLVQRLRARARGPSDADAEGLNGAEHDVRSIRPGDAYASGGRLLFESGSSGLSDSARAAAEDLAASYRGCNTVLDVRGYCSAREAYDHEDRGMRLSYERAFAVAEVLVANGLNWSQLRLVASADSDRVSATTYDEAGHKSNQRVEVVARDEAVRSSR